MKVGIITFHASFNYGSMLQAYALWCRVKQMGHDVEIINFRPYSQKKLYRFPISFKSTSYSKIHLLFYYIKHFRRYYHLTKRWLRFNDFLNKYLRMTPEYNTEQDLSLSCKYYDYLLIGSDQIWNTKCIDYCDAFFGGFVDRNTRKIAYAPSLGANPESLDPSLFRTMLHHFELVSVREEDARSFLRNNCRVDNISVTLDPTLLFDSSFYDSLMSQKPLIEGDYIYFYRPFPSRELMLMALEIAFRLRTKIVFDRYYSMDEVDAKYSSLVVFKLDSGPLEFLNLIKFSQLVVAHSLHAILFSIIYRKSFWALKGLTDSRLRHYLHLFRLEDRSIDSCDDIISKNDFLSVPVSYNKEFDIIWSEAKSFSTSFLNEAISAL